MTSSLTGSTCLRVAVRFKLLIFASLTLAWLFLTACHSDYVIPLPNAYFLARVTSKENIIGDPNGRAVVGPTVDKYAIRGDIVLGSVALNGEHSWFILDTRTRRLRTMSYDEWKRELRTMHVDESTVVPPSRLHALISKVR